MNLKDVLRQVSDLNDEFVLEPINELSLRVVTAAIPGIMPHHMRKEVTKPAVQLAKKTLEATKQIIPAEIDPSIPISGILTLANWDSLQNFTVQEDPRRKVANAFLDKNVYPTYTTYLDDSSHDNAFPTWKRTSGDPVLPPTICTVGGDQARKILQNPIFAWQHPATFLAYSEIQNDVDRLTIFTHKLNEFEASGKLPYSFDNYSCSVSELISAISAETTLLNRLTRG